MINQIEEKRIKPGSGGRGPGMHYDLRRCDFYHTDSHSLLHPLFGRQVTGGRRMKQEGSGWHMACLKGIRGFGTGVLSSSSSFYFRSSL